MAQRIKPEIDAEIEQLDVELAAIDKAMARANELGVGLGDYDLRTASQAVLRDEARKQAAEEAKLLELRRRTATQAQQQSQVPKRSTNFYVGSNEYVPIADSDTNRKMIIITDTGAIAPDSPVTVLGKNINGGFVLAGREEQFRGQRTYYPMTGTTLNISQVQGEPDKLLNINKSSFGGLSDVTDTDSLQQLIKLYE